MYRFQFEYTPEDYEVLSHLGAKTLRKKQMGIRRALSVLFAVCYFVLGALWLWRQRWVVGGVFIAVGVLFAVLFAFWHPLTARRMRKTSLKGMGALTVALEDDGIRDWHQKGEGFTPYRAITQGFHYRERYFLVLDDRQGLFLPERALVEGDVGTLKAFLEVKLGKKIKEIR